MNGDLVQIGPHRAKKRFESLRLVLTLTVAGALSGLAIVGAYEVTRPTIEAKRAAWLREAVLEVVPGSSRLQALEWRDGALVAATGEAGTEPAPYAAYDDGGRFVGYAVPGRGVGYQDVIALLYGFDPARRRVTGMWVLESSETPGLGDRIYKDDDFVANFADLAVEPEVELVKGGATAPNQVDGITGATISSRAVVRIINEANALWLERLPEPGSEPELVAPEGNDEP